MAEFTFEIEEHLLTLSENEKGWTKEINRVALMVLLQSLIFVLGAQIILKWAKGLLFPMKNFKQWWMPLKVTKFSK
ncbi:hypothetical protein smi_0833 [Streptococcus mitis B6]|uniref:Uncharacterized protein n=1 Tax=Streptococcus mitis (strain B6) TaxID=365659 RepID=D3H889_STRM6|nr:hypothetical protein smi_0833 [Streptococcus mitis B6]